MLGMQYFLKALLACTKISHENKNPFGLLHVLFHLDSLSFSQWHNSYQPMQKVLGPSLAVACTFSPSIFLK